MDFNTVIDHKRKLSELRSTLPIRVLQREQPLRYFKNPPKANGTNIWMLGGAGDQILTIPLVEELNRSLGDVVLHSRMPEVTRFFTNLPVVDDGDLILYGLDWFLSIATLPTFHFSKNFKGFRNHLMNDIYIKYMEFASDPEWESIIHHHPQMDNEMALKAVSKGLDRRSIPFAAMGIPYSNIEYGKDFGTVAPIIMDRYITVHDGFDITKQLQITRSTKNWDLLHWVWLIREIKKSYPKLMIVQLGSKASRKIPGCDLHFLGEQWSESMNVLSGSMLHIDGESGLVHAARLFDVKSIVMFGPTNAEFFGYKENINLKPRVCGGCWWLSDDSWMAKCPAGYAVPICMQSIDPVTVFREFQEQYEGS